MQTAITIAILLLATVYLFFKWIPASLRKKIHAGLAERHPQLANQFDSTIKKCASGCSSSCNSCETSTIVKSSLDVKPINFIRK
ncbi:hypothetical protein ACO0KY_06475 [Undibacterium sp. Dicai25W]|uniref:hypothetical protein n=1 Tax=Undibacterium sp. Dicai25W TaxID=3413034 RepID=UPI003BF0A57A